MGIPKIILGLFVALVLQASCFAQTFPEQDEYQFSWLDPDKKVYVLQNRKYRKMGRLGLFAQGGMDLSNPYRISYIGLGRAAYWVNEQWGVEGLFSTATNSANETLRALKAASPTALPYIREIRGYYGALATWTPWYSKLNFFNKILYYDWFFFAGLGQINSAIDQNTRVDRLPQFKEENLFAVMYGTGQNFFVTQNFTVRWDVLAMTYSATSADNRTKVTSTAVNFLLGMGYLF